MPRSPSYPLSSSWSQIAEGWLPAIGRLLSVAERSGLAARPAAGPVCRIALYAAVLAALTGAGSSAAAAPGADESSTAATAGPATTTPGTAAVSDGADAGSGHVPSSVTLSRQGDSWQLRVDGRPYTVKGAGLDNFPSVNSDPDAGAAPRAAAVDRALQALVRRGGNTIRTWGTAGLPTLLEAAARHGVMVLVGLDVRKQLEGFDYQEPAQVQAQFERVTATIEHYRKHPALLGWILANEPNLMLDGAGEAIPADPAVYAALGDILAYIHRHDPHHPATVTFAFTASLADDIAAARARLPDLDFVSLQAYGALPAIPELISGLPGSWPFMITEFGPLGHWEMPATEWGREIEEPSGLKAQGMRERMTPALTADPTGRLIGSFAFLWGQKQERTPTWYGLFTADGGHTASVDELQRFWTGEYPDDRAPLAWTITLDGLAAFDSVRLAPGDEVPVQVEAEDPEGEALAVRWELRSEVVQRSDGGQFEVTPDSLPVQIGPLQWQDNTLQADFTAPATAGDYRLYVYLSDASGGVATANIPFLVE